MGPGLRRDDTEYVSAFSRHTVPELCKYLVALLDSQRAQGMPDARCTRDLMRNVHKKCAHEHTGEAENIRHSLRNGFTAYNALPPVSHVLLPPSTPTSGRQDHTPLPYALAARVSRSL